jgi:hypothetical protein
LVPELDGPIYKGIFSDNKGIFSDKKGIVSDFCLLGYNFLRSDEI